MSDVLVHHARSLANTTLLELFARDAARTARLALEWGDWRIDFSKERLTPTVLEALVAHAEGLGVPAWIEAQFSGERVNLSEARPALHTALRQQDDRPVRVDGVDVVPAIRAVQARMDDIATTIREERWLGATGMPIRHVVSLGIGGSDLGPRLACQALAAPGQAGFPVSFVSNVDPEALGRAVATLDPATTLFLVISKTFTTQETLANAHAARRWLAAALGETAVQRHLVAVTANLPAAQAFGIDEGHVLPMWPWVGGRYSLWSAVGLPVAIAWGMDAFRRLGAGAAAMDAHVRTTPPARNAAVLLALLAWWNTRWMGAQQRLVIPYSDALRELAAYLQQLNLESNGKRVSRDGSPVASATAPALWGAPGTDAQHSFFQWLHQGTGLAPVEFIVPARARNGEAAQQVLLVSNAIAQAQALLTGRAPAQIRRELSGDKLSASELDAAVAARTCPGNRPSTTILLPQVDARNLGALLALWEHRTFVEALLFGVNPFDQWGVELGKSLAGPVRLALENGAPMSAGTDASTEALIAHARRLGAAS